MEEEEGGASSLILWHLTRRENQKVSPCDTCTDAVTLAHLTHTGGESKGDLFVGCHK